MYLLLVHFFAFSQKLKFWFLCPSQELGLYFGRLSGICTFLSQVEFKLMTLQPSDTLQKLFTTRQLGHPLSESHETASCVSFANCNIKV